MLLVDLEGIGSFADGPTEHHGCSSYDHHAYDDDDDRLLFLPSMTLLVLLLGVQGGVVATVVTSSASTAAVVIQVVVLPQPRTLATFFDDKDKDEASVLVFLLTTPTISGCLLLCDGTFASFSSGSFSTFVSISSYNGTA